jgi:hypothetical protein
MELPEGVTLIVFLRPRGTEKFNAVRYEDNEEHKELRIFGPDDKLVREFHGGNMEKWEIVDADNKITKRSSYPI